jgi:hypothetical protein
MGVQTYACHWSNIIIAEMQRGRRRLTRTDQGEQIGWDQIGVAGDLRDGRI